MIKKFLSVKVVYWAIFLLFLVIIVSVRFRLQNIPLERDEGEYAYSGQMLLHGVLPYKMAYNLKLPGTYAAYALSMALWGQSAQGVHLGLLMVNLASIILLFLIAKRLFGFVAGIVSGISYAVLSISQSVFGVHAHATHFVVVMMLCGLLLLLKAAETEKRKFIFLSGLFFGSALLMKQPGVFFFPLGIFYLSWAHFMKRPVVRSGLAIKLMTYTLGALSPFAATCLTLLFTGVFDKFLFWVFQYASRYASYPSPYNTWALFKDQLLHITSPFRSIWYIAVLGFVSIVIDAKARKHILLVGGLLIVSFLSICPGFIFREHYFVTVLPVISILAGCCVNSMHGFLRDRKQFKFLGFVPMALFTGLLLCALYQQKHYLFESTPIQVSRQSYGGNPFIESVEIANYVKADSSPQDTIAVLGSEPQIYFYSQRRSATGYIYTYALMEEQPYALRMQQEMIREIESAKPLYLICVNVYTSWGWRPRSEKLILEWSEAYSRAYYKKVGVIDIVSAERTDYYWGADAQNVKPRSPGYVLVFKRQD
jgi:hypothetical protein